jgi:hypothetical protein
MDLKSVFSAILTISFCLISSTSAIDFSSGILISYEPHEVNDVNVSPNPTFSPTLSCSWPIPGAYNEVPEATEGEHVLKLRWTNETDKKIEIRHDWDDLNFDLDGVNYILIDVYFASESALPILNKNNISIWSNWDSNTHWIACESIPPITGEWYTVGFFVGNLNYEDLNHIDALIFENMSGTAGTIYLDNLQLLKLPTGVDWPHMRRKIKFSGYWWSLLNSSYPIGAGPNYYSDEPNDVWIDRYGYAHLNITYKDPNWYCSELIGNQNFGYGQYIFTVKAREVLLDYNIVLGQFVYDVPDANNNPREIDFELSRWWHANEPNNAQYVVQPWNEPNNRYRFSMNEERTSTQEIIYAPHRIVFRSYYGSYPLTDSNNLIASWCYDGDDIPCPGSENPRINLYLLPPENAPKGTPGAPPSDGKEVEVIIKDFQFLPLPGDLNNDKHVNFNDFSIIASNWLVGLEQ